MRFVTTYLKGEDEVLAVQARKKFASYGISLHHRALYESGRHYSLGTPAFLLEHLKGGHPVVWMDIRTQFNGYPDHMPIPKDYDIIASEAEDRQTLHPTNIQLDPLVIYPSEQTLLLLKHWVAGCEEALPGETWTDVFHHLLRYKELERLGVDLLLLPRSYVKKFLAACRATPTKFNRPEEPGEHLPLALTYHDDSRGSAKATLNIQQMHAESLGFSLLGVSSTMPGPLRGASMLSEHLDEHNRPIYLIPDDLSMRRIPWFLFTTHADLVLVGKATEKLTLTHAFVNNTPGGRFLLDQVRKAGPNMTNGEFAAMHAYAMVKVVDIPNALHEEIFCEVRK